VTLLRVLLRIVLLSLAAALFTGLTGIYVRSKHSPVPNRQWQVARRNRPSAPQFSKFLEVVGESVQLGLFAVAGRIVFRLRLLPVSTREGQPIRLRLH